MPQTRKTIFTDKASKQVRDAANYKPSYHNWKPQIVHNFVIPKHQRMAYRSLNLDNMYDRKTEAGYFNTTMSCERTKPDVAAMRSTVSPDYDPNYDVK